MAMKGTNRMKRFLEKAAAALFLTGCDDGIYDLPEDAPELKTAVYVNKNDENDGYASIMYGGREYVCYGTAEDAVKLIEQDVNACVGYTGGSRSNVVCTLKETNDYIMRTFLRGFTDEPIFFRAADTLGKSIYTPGYIRGWGYGLWGKEA